MRVSFAAVLAGGCGRLTVSSSSHEQGATWMLVLALLSCASWVLSPLPQSLHSARRCTSVMQSNAASPLPSSAGAADALDLYRRLQRDAEQDTPLGRAVARGLGVMRDALRLYGPDKIVASFNGGKDAVAILHLTRAAFAAHDEAAGAGAPSRVRVIFFELDDEFPEVDRFVRDAVERHDLELVSYANVGFATGLERCIDERGSAAFVLGTRGSDPNAVGQHEFAPSSDWMPPFMRVNPILSWDYADVWAFLRVYELPYCGLYDDGYTSLGKQSNTQRNPALRRADGGYLPAWQLSDGSLERAGRTAASKAKQPPAAPDDGAVGAAADAAVGGLAAAQGPGSSTEDATPAAAADGPSRLAAQTAALLVVGDEILSGKTADHNTVEAARRLRAAGLRLERVCVVSDAVDEIVTELNRLRARFDLVFTSGGLGPTHDDITLRAVSQACGMQMVRNAEMAQTITSRYAAMDRSLPAEVLEKMSTLPSGAVLRYVPDEPTAWPILQCGTVFVLPGVPEFFRAKLTTILANFVRGAAPVLSRSVRLAISEEEIVASLNAIVEAHPQVSIGSYPVNQGRVQTIITLEAANADATLLEKSLSALLALLPQNDVVVEVSESTALAPAATSDAR